MVKADTGDSEMLTLTETALDSGMFAAILPTETLYQSHSQ
jgi:hypothetical protein